MEPHVPTDRIAAIRIDYSRQQLDEKEIAADPVVQFHRWFAEALAAQINEPNAMCLSTCTPEGRPAARIVLLKGVEEAAFVFYTNYHSKKGRMVEANPYVALTFFWPELERQVRIEGFAEKTTPEMSDQYFASRPRASQIGAWVSSQSEHIENRQVLEDLLVTTEANFENQEILRPPHWGGYRVVPQLVEFWQGRPSRLHDRVQYTRLADAWKTERLAP